MLASNSKCWTRKDLVIPDGTVAQTTSGRVHHLKDVLAANHVQAAPDLFSSIRQHWLPHLVNDDEVRVDPVVIRLANMHHTSNGAAVAIQIIDRTKMHRSNDVQAVIIQSIDQVALFLIRCHRLRLISDG